MATVSSIASAIATQLDALSFVDSASADGYLPAAASVTCVAFVIPFDQETTSDFEVMGGTVTLRHILTVEFWTQIKTGATASAMATARDASALAIAKLITMDGTGYDLEPDIPFQERIYPAPVTHAGVPWFVTSLRVPVRNEVSA